MWVRAVRSIGAFSLVLAAHAAVRADDDKEIVHHFKFGFHSKAVLKIEGVEQNFDAQSELLYSWQRKGGERVLRFTSTGIQIVVDGKKEVDFFASREKHRKIVDGKGEELTFAMAPADLQQMLRDSFGAPFLKVHVDDEGWERKRELLAGPGAKPLLDKGEVQGALLFHAPLPRGVAKWQAEREVNMGNGIIASGKLTYEKLPVGKDVQRVKVAGTLSKDGFVLGGLTAKVARYELSGEQTYNFIEREWVNGKMSVAATIEFTADGRTVGAAKGTITVVFQKVPAPK